MAGLWQRTGNVTVTNGSKTITGFGTKWKTGTLPIQKGHTFYGPDNAAYEVDTVVSDESILLVDTYRGGTLANQPYRIDITRTSTISQFAADLASLVAKYRTWFDGMMTWLTGSGDVAILNPDTGANVTIPSWKKVASEGEGQTARAKVEADRAKTEADRAAAAANATAEAGTGSLMRVGGATILDAERYALERATGGRQTIIRDSAGNANAMFVLPRFSYADLGMTADMGTGDVTAFDFGTGSIKGEIFIGAYLASGSGAVSAPRQEPRTSLDHTAARNACSAKGAGWHLMTAHEWAAIALWCMANGYEPIGNTNSGRSHAKTWMVGDRADNRAPGDGAGTGRTQTGSMGSEATHTRTLGGIADLVGNVWEWQDGLLLQDGRFKISAYNTQAEVDWAFVDAYLDASSLSGGSAILSSAITNRLGALGDNANTGNFASVDWRSMTKAGGYVSLQALRRLLVEPASVLPQGRIYMRNFGERLPYRGGGWSDGSNAGLAALVLHYSRVYMPPNLGFRPAFA
ncbi:SUMF1/EgtB/PvdO family nonheme iron enzyme [Aeromonas caviae]|uniref:SUMF1/EgtB/PvdO family nonheme iron enzyme n=1 Tax=Aeromonas caviae TaxID=648 RepID=UPI00249BD0E4|nr:SUMF1/EgtB/PvdO family nonheme iron enzyme [Aeromonas caviae]WGY77580.1 SUMF1/EgtB/PvdO family nonheme iron enzyme [Aeromonas caviae]